jgi:hypothetical protein
MTARHKLHAWDRRGKKKLCASTASRLNNLVWHFENENVILWVSHAVIGVTVPITILQELADQMRAREVRVSMGGTKLSEQTVIHFRQRL